MSKSFEQLKKEKMRQLARKSPVDLHDGEPLVIQEDEADEDEADEDEADEPGKLDPEDEEAAEYERNNARDPSTPKRPRGRPHADGKPPQPRDPNAPKRPRGRPRTDGKPPQSRSQDPNAPKPGVSSFLRKDDLDRLQKLLAERSTAEKTLATVDASIRALSRKSLV